MLLYCVVAVFKNFSMHFWWELPCLFWKFHFLLPVGDMLEKNVFCIPDSVHSVDNITPILANIEIFFTFNIKIHTSKQFIHNLLSLLKLQYIFLYWIWDIWPGAYKWLLVYILTQTYHHLWFRGWCPDFSRVRRWWPHDTQGWRFCLHRCLQGKTRSTQGSTNWSLGI